MITERTLLETAFSLLEGGDKWCKKHYHLENKHCILGAVYEAMRRLTYSMSQAEVEHVLYAAIDRLENAAEDEFGRGAIIVNDAIDSDFSYVERIYKRAIDECS